MLVSANITQLKVGKSLKVLTIYLWYSVAMAKGQMSESSILKGHFITIYIEYSESHANPILTPSPILLFTAHKQVNT